jgi:hypothetical protein
LIKESGTWSLHRSAITWRSSNSKPAALGGGAIVEVLGNLSPALLGELAVEVVVQLVDRRAAVDFAA